MSKTYVVRGHWPFPLDMLRHDLSGPATPADKALIDKMSAEHPADATSFMDVEITLVGACAPNTERWESFGWQVPADTHYAFYKAAKKAARAREELAAKALAKLTPAEREALGFGEAG